MKTLGLGFGVGFLALIAVATVERPAVAQPKAVRPVWCADYSVFKHHSSSYSFDDHFKDVTVTADSSPDGMLAERFANVLCTTGTVTDRDKIMALRDQWMKLNGLDEGDFISVVSIKLGYTFEKQDLGDIPGPASQLPIDGRIPAAFDYADSFDARLSMISRFVLLTRCIEGVRGRQIGLLFRVLCTRESIDQAKAYAEIDSVKEFNSGTRYKLRKLVREAGKFHAKEKAEIDALAKDDPGIAKVVAIADAVFKEWASPSAKRIELLALVDKMENATNANKRSGFAGCDVPTKKAWKDHVATLKMPKMPVKGVLELLIQTTLNSADGYLAYQALRLCSIGLDGKLQKSDFIGADVERRGPRSATIAAWLAASGEIKFDDKALKFGPSLFLGFGMKSGRRYEEPRQGAIAKITPLEDGVEISFKKVIEKREDCVRWVETGQILNWYENGTPIYRRNCTKWGPVKVDLTAESVVIGKVMADGLKPGMYLFATDGLAIVATANAKSSKPIWVFGAPAK